MPQSGLEKPLGVRRWWTYQRERFPVLAHGPLIAAFSLSSVCYSSLVRGNAAIPGPGPLLVAFVSAFLFFLQLRILDEFKDQEEDARFRPYRPVPRGLVTLRELGAIGVAGALIQLALALWLDAEALLPLLILVWLYLALMAREFFAGEWLRARPAVYMASHLLILPLIDLYATACDWRVAGANPPHALAWLLLISLLNGVVLEVGRKMRAPGDEEPGVETYTRLWGRRMANGVWLGTLFVAGICAWPATAGVGFHAPAAALLAPVLTIASVVVWSFRQKPEPRFARLFEPLSGLWILLTYLSLGILPLLWGIRGGAL